MRETDAHLQPQVLWRCDKDCPVSILSALASLPRPTSPHLHRLHTPYMRIRHTRRASIKGEQQVFRRTKVVRQHHCHRAPRNTNNYTAVCSTAAVQKSRAVPPFMSCHDLQHTAHPPPSLQAVEHTRASIGGSQQTNKSIRS